MRTTQKARCVFMSLDMQGVTDKLCLAAFNESMTNQLQSDIVARSNGASVNATVEAVEAFVSDALTSAANITLASFGGRLELRSLIDSFNQLIFLLLLADYLVRASLCNVA